jgi:hypothetical protein
METNLSLLQTAALWVIATALVVLAVLAYDDRDNADASEEEACYARVLTLGSGSVEYSNGQTGYYLSDSAERSRNICDMKFGRGAWAESD